MAKCKAAIVVLPGMDGMAALSSVFADMMRATFESVVTISYPPDRFLGYGELEALVRSLLPKDTPYVLLGQSFSGPIAISIAAARPSGLMGLILSTAFSQSPLPWLSPLSSLTGIAPVRALPRAVLSWFLLGRWATQELESMLQASLRAVKPSVLRSRAAAALEIDVSHGLSAIAVPVLCLRASNDRLFSSEVSARMLKAIPRAEVKDISGPHLLLQASPSACAEAILEYASRLTLA